MKVTNISITSYNGTAINDGTNYTARFPTNMPILTTADVVESPRNEDSPVYSGKEIKSRTFPITIGINAGSVETLENLFDTREIDMDLLVVTDTATSETYYVYATPISFTMQPPRVCRVVLHVSDPVWRKVTADTSDVTYVADSTNTNITNGGSYFCRPTFTITPLSAKTRGFKYARYVIVYNQTTNSAKNYPINILGTTVDHSALVADTTKSNQLNGAINDTVTTINIDTAVGGGLPSIGMGYVDTEQISWTANSGTQLTGVTRGLGTTAASHADNAVIKRSKARADGADWRISVDRKVANHFVKGGGYNSSTLKDFVNLDFSPKVEASLGVAIASSGAITTITLATSQASLTALKSLRFAANKVVLIDSELFTYTGISAALYQLTGVTRAQRFSSMAAHTVADTVRWIEHDIYVYHGDESATAQTIDTDYAPMFGDTSTNTSWIYTNYYDPLLPNRSAQFNPNLISSLGINGGVGVDAATVSAFYTANHNTDVTSGSADEMGMRIQSYLSGASYNGERASLEWVFLCPFGSLTDVTTSGEKYRAVSDWPSAKLQKLLTAGMTKWVDVWSEATPGSATTWTAFGPTASSLSGNYSNIRYFFDGWVAGASGNYSALEVDTITLTKSSSLIPSVTLGSEITDTTAYNLAISLNNTTTSQKITLEGVVAINDSIVVNCDAQTVIINTDTNALGYLALNTTRREWMRFASGSNTINVAETGAASIKVVMTWNERSL